MCASYIWGLSCLVHIYVYNCHIFLKNGLLKAAVIHLLIDFTKLFFFFNESFFIFIYFWLCWVFVSVWGLSLVVASGGPSSSWCAGLSLSRPLLLRSTSSRCAGSVVVAHRPSCSAAYGIFPDQGSNPCALHWQADSQPLRHQGSPELFFAKTVLLVIWGHWHLFTFSYV